MPLLNEGWLYPSHEALFEGVWKDLGPGCHRDAKPVPLAGGRILIDNYADRLDGNRVFRDQVAQVELLLSHDSIVASVKNIRQKHTGDEVLIRGIDYVYGSNIYRIEPETDVPVRGYEVELLRDHPYQVTEIGQDGDGNEVENPDYRVANAFISICSKALTGMVSTPAA